MQNVESSAQPLDMFVSSMLPTDHCWAVFTFDGIKSNPTFTRKVRCLGGVVITRELEVTNERIVKDQVLALYILLKSTVSQS